MWDYTKASADVGERGGVYARHDDDIDAVGEIICEVALEHGALPRCVCQVFNSRVKG